MSNEKMKKFLNVKDLNKLTPQELLNYRKELKKYYPILHEHIVLFAKTFSNLEHRLSEIINYMQDTCDELEIERLDSTENDLNNFTIQ